MSEVLMAMTLKINAVGSPGILVNFYQAHSGFETGR